MPAHQGDHPLPPPPGDGNEDDGHFDSSDDEEDENEPITQREIDLRDSDAGYCSVFRH